MKINKTSTKKLLDTHLNNKAPTLITRSKLVLHNIRSMYNVGAIFRNADAFNIGEIILSGFTPTPPRPEISKTAIGAEETVKWSHPSDIMHYLSTLSASHLLIGIEQTNISVPLDEFEISAKPVCLFLGNEVTGLDSKLLEHMHHVVQITQYGHKHSLNVSVTAGICMYEFLQKYRNL